METIQPNEQDMDVLIAFLPQLYGPRTTPVRKWHYGEAGDGTLISPFPEYSEEVESFFMLAGRPCWSDYGYRPEEAHRMLYDEPFVRQCGIEDIKTMLTYCVRGERFSPGFWGEMIEEGKIRLLLERLAQIRNDP